MGGSMARSRYERGLDLVTANHGAVDTQSHVAARALRDGAAEAGSEAARHRRLHGELAGDAALGAHRAHRLEHGRGAAGVDSGAARLISLQKDREQVGYEAAV